MSDADVDRRSGRNVPGLSGLFFLVWAEESSVVALLDDDEGYAGLVVRLQLDAGLSNRGQLMLQNLN